MLIRVLRLCVLFLIFIPILSGCSGKKRPLFRILSSTETGVTFNNQITENEYLNILTDEYIYNGAGVGIADFNNDGLPDLYFCGNMVSNKLYLNRGNLKFEDITDIAGVAPADHWSTAVSIADVNRDGWADIYVCASYSSRPENRRNILYINKGLNPQGIPVFTDEARAYGVDDDGFSSGAAFFDYDHDNDPDLYVLTNVLDNPTPNKYRPKITDGTALTNDRLYRNNGNGTFTNVSKEAGIRFEGYGLGISVVDFNKDGWPDLYITNDYLTNDLMYINNRNGTFTNPIASHIKHQAHSAMGHDIADINNDGWPDIFSLDMLPANNEMLKRMYGTSRWINNLYNKQFGYEFQYKRNMLQLNNGMDALGNFLFSEIGFYSGVQATDWSWSALLADFDNDGYRDLFVSNGYPRDITDLDYATSDGRGMGTSHADVLKQIPARNVDNYLFRNDGDLTFTDYTRQWGIDVPSYSSGAAYADLDHDGDLDMVCNNINAPAFIYENLLYSNKRERLAAHFIRFKLLTGKNEPFPEGTKLYLYAGGGRLHYAEFSINHGYASASEPVVHFGLGEAAKADSLIVIWPDGKEQKLTDLKIDQVNEIKYSSAVNAFERDPALEAIPPARHQLFTEVSAATNLTFIHQEEPFDDFMIQHTLPFQLSQSGPALAVGDANHDGQEDVFIGGSTDHPGVLMIQDNGRFFPEPLGTGKGKKQEDMGCLFFDADRDGDNDLYIVSGGFEQPPAAESYQDRLYLNDGKGNFTEATQALPKELISGSCVKAADYDRDGDLDLFIGGRVIPAQYPLPTKSRILRNDSGNGSVRFTDVTNEECPELNSLGVVNDAIWTDFDNDGLFDLIVVGEWMPVTFLKNEGRKFHNITAGTGIKNSNGWWNSIAAGDFDNDGDIDYMVGNQGRNSLYRAGSHEPVIAYGSDFDRDGRFDLVIGSYATDRDGSRKLFPVHFRNDLIEQLGFIRQRFTSFGDYGKATLDDLFTQKEIASAKKFETDKLESVYIENKGNERFEMRDMPQEVQWAPVFGMIPLDLNADACLDFIAVGNFYGNNPFWGRDDAMNGLVLTGDGKGNFKFMNYPASGFLVPGDAKALILLPVTNGRILVLASQNQDSLKCFEIKHPLRSLPEEPMDAWAIAHMKTGGIRKMEFYYGNSYLSQSARIMTLPDHADSLTVYDFRGKSRIVSLP